mmetsp:Transcript_176907/g.567372  ORF Transcript_176907/g.567372 Transcript_176907/m.567372 type:complete len:200 (-) Transcript_176907:759-1358(-)
MSASTAATCRLSDLKVQAIRQLAQGHGDDRGVARHIPRELADPLHGFVDAPRDGMPTRLVFEGVHNAVQDDGFRRQVAHPRIQVCDHLVHPRPDVGIARQNGRPTVGLVVLGDVIDDILVSELVHDLASLHLLEPPHALVEDSTLAKPLRIERDHPRVQPCKSVVALAFVTVARAELRVVRRYEIVAHGPHERGGQGLE